MPVGSVIVTRLSYPYTYWFSDVGFLGSPKTESMLVNRPMPGSYIRVAVSTRLVTESNGCPWNPISTSGFVPAMSPVSPGLAEGRIAHRALRCARAASTGRIHRGDDVPVCVLQVEAGARAAFVLGERGATGRVREPRQR